MIPTNFLEIQVLESFFNENGYIISRATITRYGQLGLMLEPKRKQKLSAPSESRVYYNPIVAIEILTASHMIAGKYVSNKSTHKMARFTSEDVFWSRILFYAEHLDKPQNLFFSVDDFTTNIRLAHKGKYNSYSFPSNQTFLKAITDDDIIYVNKDFQCLSLLKQKYFNYLHLFSETNTDLFTDYISMLKRIYANIFFAFLEQHRHQLHNYEYSILR